LIVAFERDYRVACVADLTGEGNCTDASSYGETKTVLSCGCYCCCCCSPDIHSLSLDYISLACVQLVSLAIYLSYEVNDCL
jgi:hypothetical protein